MSPVYVIFPPGFGVGPLSVEHKYVMEKGHIFSMFCLSHDKPNIIHKLIHPLSRQGTPQSTPLGSPEREIAAPPLPQPSEVSFKIKRALGAR